MWSRTLRWPRMRTFNRLIVILLLIGVFLLGVYAVVYSFDLLGYKLGDFFGIFSDARSSVNGFVGAAENGELSLLYIAILVLIALVGLILLVMELKPRRPRRVRMQKGTYVTRGVVEEQVAAAAEQTPDVLGAKVKAKARRRQGAKVKLEAHVRRGENVKEIRTGLRDSVNQHMTRNGVPLSRLKIRLIESDPRNTKTRVQ